MLENNQGRNQDGTKAHGGARKGAGRKPGSATKRTREIADREIGQGLTPLEFMLRIMRDEPPQGLEPSDELRANTLRFEAAKAAAPYMHPRLAAVEHSGPEGQPLQPIVHFVRDASPPQ